LVKFCADEGRNEERSADSWINPDLPKGPKQAFSGSEILVFLGAITESDALAHLRSDRLSNRCLSSRISPTMPSTDQTTRVSGGAVAARSERNVVPSGKKKLLALPQKPLPNANEVGEGSISDPLLRQMACQSSSA